MMQPRTSEMQAAASSERDAGGVDDFAENGFGLLGFFLGGDVARADHHAVREDRNDQALEIVGQAIVAAFEESAGLRGAMEHDGASRAYAQAQLLGLARALDDVERVVEQAVVDFHLRDRFLHGDHVGRVHERSPGSAGGLARIVADDFLFAGARGIAHADAHEETIELRFGQRIGAMVLDGILRGEHQKRLRQAGGCGCRR